MIKYNFLQNCSRIKTTKIFPSYLNRLLFIMTKEVDKCSIPLQMIPVVLLAIRNYCSYQHMYEQSFPPPYAYKCVSSETIVAGNR